MAYNVLEAVDNPVEKPKSEKEKVGLWHSRIAVAKKTHDDWVDESGAKRFCNEYNGKFDLTMVRREKVVPVDPVNDVFAYVQSDIASTYNRNPYLSVVPTAGTVFGAKLLEVWVNYEWRELKTKEELEYEIIDKDLVGFAWHKVGHTVTSEGTGEQLKILSQKLYSMRIDWRDILWNLGARRPPYDCQWMAQRITRPIEDIKRRFPNAKGLKGVKHPDIDDDTYKNSAYKDDIEVGIYYEIWDARAKEIYLIADGLNDKYLDAPKSWPEYLDEFPFLMYWDFVSPYSARPLSSIASWEPQLLQKMVILAQAVNHVKRWNRQLIVTHGAIDTTALDKFERGDDGAIIENTGTGELDKHVKPLDFGQLPTDFYQILDRIDAIIRYVNGQPEFLKGGVTKTNTRTDGELDKIRIGAKGRIDKKIDRLETHLENIGRHMLFHMLGNFDFERVVKVVDETPEEVIQELGDRFDPATRSVTFTEEEIKGEYDIEIVAGSTLPLNEETQEATLKEILERVAPIAGQGAISPFVNALIQELLRKYKIKSIEEAYKMELQLAEEAAAQRQGQQSVEDQKTMADAKKREAQAMEVSADAEIKRQDASIGPEGRAAMESAKKPEQKPQTVGVG